MGCCSSRKCSSHPTVVFVIGGPGSGKGTQCANIKKTFGYEHLSTGDILRRVVEKKENPKWKELKEKMDKGDFVSSEELLGYVKNELESMGNKKVLLDGFPRNQENIDEWNKQMKNVCEVSAVIYFECTEEEMKKRMLSRNEGRSDDNEETINKRVENFLKDTKPLIEIYDKIGKLIRIDAMKGVEQIFEDVKAKMIEKKLN